LGRLACAILGRRYTVRADRSLTAGAGKQGTPFEIPRDPHSMNDYRSPARPSGESHGNANGDVLLLSMRRIARLVAYCIEYEFEDVIGDLTGAHCLELDNESRLDFSRRIYKYTRSLFRSRRIARAASDTHPVIRLDRDYDLFLPIFNHPYELFGLAAVPDWRKRCRVAACFVSEVWVHQCPQYLLELLADFDHVFLGVNHSVKDVERVVGRPCSYLPLAVDVLRFAPYPNGPQRSIDVCNIGRRSQDTHQALLRRGQAADFFYYYDTVAASGIDLKQRTFRVQDPAEHRMLLASLLKRSRYYLASRGFANDPAFTKGRDEISARFYEGAAAGTVMIGVPPETKEFAEQFNWPEPIIRAPFDCPGIVELIAELESDPARVSSIRRNNVHHAALRHDWLYRLRSIFDVLGIAPTDAMLRRQQRLQDIAARALEEI
jgi:hypothetical protein